MKKLPILFVLFTIAIAAISSTAPAELPKEIPFPECDFTYIISAENGKIVKVGANASEDSCTATLETPDDRKAHWKLIFSDNGNGQIGLVSQWNDKLLTLEDIHWGDCKVRPRTDSRTTLNGGWECLAVEPTEDGFVTITRLPKKDFYASVAPDGTLKTVPKGEGRSHKFIVVTPKAPEFAPQEIAATKKTSKTATLAWKMPSGTFFTGFSIFCSENGGEFEKVFLAKNPEADATGRYYVTVPDLKPATAYRFKVAAKNVRGDSPASPEVETKTFDGEPASPPTGLKIGATENHPEISWRGVSGATGYQVYRSESRFGRFVKITEKPTTETTFIDGAAPHRFGYYRVEALNAFAPSEPSETVSLETEIFGPNTLIFHPEDDKDEVRALISLIGLGLIDGSKAHFTDKRVALLFKPGDYGWLQYENGFYMHSAGLGKLPTDTKLDRVVVQTDWLGNNNATCNFWRVLENMTLLNKAGTEFQYGIAQAAPVRRMMIHGKIRFDVHYGWASGGYLADSVVTESAGSPSQQQFFVRNNRTPFTGVNWNFVAVGNIGDVGDNVNRNVVPETPVVYEKPFLYFENGEYQVFVPGRRENAVGPSWTETDPGPGRSISLSDFYVARSDRDDATSLNAALARGKHLLLTPGFYKIDRALEVVKPDTVVLGIGLASLHPTDGNNALNVADVEGVRLAGFIIDAGSGENPDTETKGTECLMRVGTKGAKADLSENPIVLSDLFFRVGGVDTPVACKADISLEINAPGTVCDHFWIWRADHGQQVGWELNKAEYGLVVNGDDVTIYGLFVEHYRKYDTLWNGENGRMYFYQNEKAYDVPTQKDWVSPDGNGHGYAAYRVADHVKKHEARGLGIYSVFINTKDFVLLENAILVPETGDITIHNPVIVSISNNGGIEHVINGVGVEQSSRNAKIGVPQRLPESYKNIWRSK